MESLLELLMVKQSKSNGSEADPGDVLSMIEKIRAYGTARGFSSDFLNSTLRYDRSSQFFTMLFLGCPVNLVLQDIRGIADDFVRRISELCLVWGITLTPVLLDLELDKYLLLVAFDRVHAEMKLQTNFVLANFFGTDLPEGVFLKDFFPRPLSFRIKRMGCNDLSKIRRKSNCSLIYTIVQGFKKGLFGGFPSMVVSSLKKHKKALSVEGTPINSVVMDRVEALCGQLAQEFQVSWNENHLVDNFSLGSRATVQSSCMNGGELGYSTRELPQKDLPTVLGYVRPVHPVYSTVDIVSRDIFDEEGDWVGDDLIEETRTHSCTDFLPSSLREEVQDPEPVVLDGYLPMMDEYLEVFPPRVFDPENNSPMVEPACIIEPLKVRIITKPEVGIFTRLRSIQKKLWGFLVNHSSGFFSLCGEPLQRAHLWKIVSGWTPGDQFCSGDYSAATDNLKSEITEVLLKHLLGKVFCNDPANWTAAFNSMLNNSINVTKDALPSDPLYHVKELGKEFKGKFFSHSFSSDPDFEDDELTYDQKNGQLMGNVLSFPILCLANYLAYHISRELVAGRMIPLWKVPPVLINGDDILFKTNYSHYAVWRDVVKEFGFFPSMGKNLLSDKILQINSELWGICTRSASTPGQWIISDLYKVPFVNFGLVTFRGKQDCSRDLEIYNSSGFDFSVGKVVDKIQSQTIARASCSAEIYDQLITESGPKLASKADLLFKRHFAFLQKIFPGLEVGTVDSGSFNRCLFKRRGGVSLPDSLLTAFTKRFPGLKLTTIQLAYCVDQKNIRYAPKIVQKKKDKLKQKFDRYNAWRVEIGLLPISTIGELPKGEMDMEVVF